MAILALQGAVLVIRQASIELRHARLASVPAEQAGAAAMSEAAAAKEREEGEAHEEYGELLKFTLAGFAGGLITGAILDWLDFQRSAWGQWLVRTLSGEGESIFEGIYPLLAAALDRLVDGAA